jgi:hypothetical protein
MKKIALFAIIALTASCIDATAQNKKRYEKVLFVLTSHSELGDTGENRVLDRRICCSLLRVSRQRSNH